MNTEELRYSASRMRVIGLHKLPFDADAFEREMNALRAHDAETLAILRVQYRENWDQAWLVVVEFDGQPEELDYGLLSHGEDPHDSSNQVPWLERVLESDGRVTRAGVYRKILAQLGICLVAQ